MRLFNQGNTTLTWDDGPFNYKWEPFGFVDVDEKALPHIRAQKLAVGVSPVSPENRARAEADAAQAAALSSDTRKLQLALNSAQADCDAAKAETERVKVQLVSIETRCADATKRAQEASDKLADVTSERDALKTQLAGAMVTGIAEIDAEVAKLKAELTEVRSSLKDARDAEAKAVLAERAALAKAAGSETAALEALEKVDALKAEVAALKKELASRIAAEVKPKK